MYFLCNSFNRIYLLGEKIMKIDRLLKYIEILLVIKKIFEGILISK